MYMCAAAAAAIAAAKQRKQSSSNSSSSQAAASAAAAARAHEEKKSAWCLARTARGALALVLHGVAGALHPLVVRRRAVLASTILASEVLPA